MVSILPADSCGSFKERSSIRGLYWLFSQDGLGNGNSQVSLGEGTPFS